MKLLFLFFLTLTSMQVLAQSHNLPDSTVESYANTLCTCVSKHYKKEATREANIKMIDKCKEEINLLFPYTDKGKELEAVLNDKNKKAALEKEVAYLLLISCGDFRTIAQTPKTVAPEPKQTTEEKYFLPAATMTAKKLKLTKNDGQMHVWTATNVTSNKIQNVYDIRYVFNNEEDAQKYYAAKLEYLSEKAPEVKNELEKLGVTESNVFSDNSAAAFGLDMKMKNYIFRINNVVAKVFVAANGKTTDAEMLSFAKQAIAKIKAAK